MDHLDRWATDGTPPPPSCVPNRAVGTLVEMDEWRTQYPPIPSVVTPQQPNRLPLFDYGPDADKGYITIDPPAESAPGEEYAILVPALDEDGNEIAGIRMPLVQAPLGTCTGWNIRKRGGCPGDMADMSGSFIPFPRTRAERLATGDPRASIEERYAGEEDFIAAIVRAPEEMAAAGFLLLEEDQDAIVKGARKVWQLICRLA